MVAGVQNAGTVGRPIRRNDLVAVGSQFAEAVEIEIAGVELADLALMSHEGDPAGKESGAARNALHGSVGREEGCLAIVGASGSVFALIAALTWAMPDRRLTLLLFFVLPITLQARTIFWGLFAITSFCIAFPSKDGIAHGAHLGGFLLGWGFAHWVLLGSFSLAGWNVFARLRDKKSCRRKVVRVGTARAFSSTESNVIEAEEISKDEFIKQEIDPILEKITKEGVHSLTSRERKILDEARRRMK